MLWHIDTGSVKFISELGKNNLNEVKNKNVFEHNRNYLNPLIFHEIGQGI